MILVSAWATPATEESSESQAGSVQVEFRLAELMPTDTYEKMEMQGSDTPIFVSPETELSNNDVVSTSIVGDQAGQLAVEVILTKEGGEHFALITKQHLNKPVAVLIDGQVICAPLVRGVIGSGRAIISGNFTEEEAERIAAGIIAGEAEGIEHAESAKVK